MYEEGSSRTRSGALDMCSRRWEVVKNIWVWAYGRMLKNEVSGGL